MKKMVCGFLFSLSGDCVVLIKRLPTQSHPGLLNAVGGKVEEEETLHQAMVREFREETGLQTKEKDWDHRLVIFPKGRDEKRYEVNVFTAYSPLWNAVKTQEEGDVVIMPLRDLKNDDRLKYVPNLHEILILALRP